VSVGEQFTLFTGGGERHEFSVNMTGYTEHGHLGGGLTGSGTDALQIRNNSRTAAQLYLIGTVMDNYTGSSWTRSYNFDDLAVNELTLDYIETLLALHYGGVLDLPPEDRGDVFETRDITVTYLNLRTRSLFYPRGVYDLRSDGRLDADVSGSSLLWRRPADTGTQYRVQYIDLNYSSDVLIDLLLSGVYTRPGLSVTQLNRLHTGQLMNIPEDYAEVLYTRRNSIYDVYTVLPPSVPANVYGLAHDITAGHDGSYAKMKAIEQYLLDNYTYTRTPQVIHEGDITAAFLFEMREGYCTYFATAAAVLGRAAGIPTRYIQGFTVQAATTVVSQSYTIADNAAHAWVEAYIDGVGWVPLEPSPEFVNARYGSWVNRRITAGQGTVPSEPRPGRETVEPAETPEETEQRLGQERRNVYLIALVFGGAVILIAVTAVFSGFIITLKRARKRYTMSSPTERFLHDYKAILFFLGHRGDKPQTGETAKCFAARLGDDMFSCLTDTFEQVRYGGKETTADTSSAAEEYKAVLAGKAEGLSIIRKKLYIL